MANLEQKFISVIQYSLSQHSISNLPLGSITSGKKKLGKKIKSCKNLPF